MSMSNLISGYITITYDEGKKSMTAYDYYSTSTHTHHTEGK